MKTGLTTHNSQKDAGFSLGSSIGNTAIVVVRKARKPGSKDWPYAQKNIRLDDESVDNARREFLQEVKTLQYAQHCHVVKYVDAFAVQGKVLTLALVMARAGSGSIQDYLTAKRPRDTNPRQIQQWIACLINVVDHIHGIGIRHRDIKPANILIDKRKVLLADFGVSQMGLGQTLSTTIPEWARGRTATYCAPEVDEGSTRGRSADIFSLGAVFLEMLVAEFSVCQLQDLKRVLASDGGPSYAKKTTEVHEWMDGFEEKIKRTPEDDWRRKVLSLCREMLHEDREERPKAFQLKADLSSFSGSALPTCDCSSPDSMTSDERLIQACKDGKEDSVRPLVESGAKPGAVGAIHQASARGHSGIVRDLLNLEPATINLLDHSHQTALHCAAGNNQQTIVDILLRRKAKVAIQDAQGRTALHYAAGCGNVGMVEALLRGMEAQYDVEDLDGRTPLHFAAKRGHEGVVHGLLKGANPNAIDKKGRTALHFASAHGAKGIVEMLLGRVDQNAQDENGWTALHFAVKGKQTEGQYEEVVRLLLKRRVDTLKADSKGHLASAYAKKNETPGWKLLSNATLRATAESLKQMSEDS